MCRDYCMCCERFVCKPCCHYMPEKKESMEMQVQRKIGDFRMKTGNYPKYLFIDPVSFQALANDIIQMMYHTQGVLASSIEIKNGNYHGTKIKVLEDLGRCVEVA